MKKKRILALVLCLCMLLGVLSGCSKDEPGEKPGPGQTDGPSAKPSGGKTDNAAAQTSAKYVYVTQYVDFDLDCEWINYTCVSGNYAYFIGDVMTDPGSEGAGGVLYDTPAVEAAVETVNVGVETLPVEGEPLPDEPVEEPIQEYIPPTYETRIYQIDLTTGEQSVFDSYVEMPVPEGAQGDCWVNMFMPGADGTVWVYDTLDSYVLNLPENFDPANDYEWNYQEQLPTQRRLQQFSAQGELLNTVMIDPAIAGDTGWIDVRLVDEYGHIYAYNWETGLFILDAQGQLVKTIELDSENGESLSTFCGQASVERWGEERSIRLIDPETLEVEEEELDPPYNAYGFMKSYDEAYDYYYQLNYNIYGYRIAEKVSEKIVDWVDCDVDISGLSSIYPLEDGRIMALISEWDQETGENLYSAVFLTKTDAATVKPKTVLTLACMYIDWDLRSRIVDFNRQSEDYRILINDYSQYATEEDYNAGLLKLNTEILSGKVPDLLYSNGNMPIEQYGAQGYLEDLYPYIDADQELSREQLMQNVLEAASQEGKLYQAFSSFTVETTVGLEKVVGDYDQWSLPELQDAMTKLQPGATVFSVGWVREDVLRNCVNRNLSAFVNWETGECSFDSEEFRQLLEFANSFPEEFDWADYEENGGTYLSDQEALVTGQQLLGSFYLYSFLDCLWNLSQYRDEAICFVGYPSTQGNNNTFNLGGGLSISTTCADKEGAWNFVRQVFTEEYQRETYYDMPTNKALFDEQVKEATTIEYATDENGEYLLDENGEKVINYKAYVWIDEETTLEIPCMTQEQADQLLELVNSIHSVAIYDEALFEIVSDEAAGYFAGQVSLDEVVKRIQNRVSLYVAEQS